MNNRKRYLITLIGKNVGKTEFICNFGNSMILIHDYCFIHYLDNIEFYNEIYDTIPRESLTQYMYKFCDCAFIFFYDFDSLKYSYNYLNEMNEIEKKNKFENIFYIESKIDLIKSEEFNYSFVYNFVNKNFEKKHNFYYCKVSNMTKQGYPELKYLIKLLNYKKLFQLKQQKNFNLIKK